MGGSQHEPTRHGVCNRDPEPVECLDEQERQRTEPSRQRRDHGRREHCQNGCFDRHPGPPCSAVTIPKAGRRVGADHVGTRDDLPFPAKLNLAAPARLDAAGTGWSTALTGRSVAPDRRRSQPAQ